MRNKMKRTQASIAYTSQMKKELSSLNTPRYVFFDRCPNCEWEPKVLIQVLQDNPIIDTNASCRRAVQVVSNSRLFFCPSHKTDLFNRIPSLATEVRLNNKSAILTPLPLIDFLMIL